jgi:TonB family protein
MRQQKPIKSEVFFSNYKVEVYSQFAGFQENSKVEMFILPSGAKFPQANSLTTDLDSKFFDDSALPQNTIQKTGVELLKSITKKIEPLYPPAARAVRVSGNVMVQVEINEKGNVEKTAAFSGHPLLRAACVSAIRQWQFKPEKQKGVPVRVIGVAICEFKPIDE